MEQTIILNHLHHRNRLCNSVDCVILLFVIKISILESDISDSSFGSVTISREYSRKRLARNFSFANMTSNGRSDVWIWYIMKVNFLLMNDRDFQGPKILNIENNTSFGHVKVMDENCFVFDGQKINAFHNRYEEDTYHKYLDMALKEALPNPNRSVLSLSCGPFLVCFGCGPYLWTLGLNTINPTISESACEEPKLQLISNAHNIKEVSVGSWHVLVISDSGVLLTFGRGECGQLGIGRKVDWIESPQVIQIKKSVTVERSDPLLLDPIVQIAAGALHSAVVCSSGLLYTFGCAANGRLGATLHPSISSTSVPSLSPYLSTSDSLSPYLVDEMIGTGNLLPNGKTTGVRLCACGVWHTVAVCGDGDIYGWGWAKFGQLGRS
jgi:hypothetical protein